MIIIDDNKRRAFSDRDTLEMKRFDTRYGQRERERESTIRNIVTRLCAFTPAGNLKYQIVHVNTEYIVALNLFVIDENASSLFARAFFSDMFLLVVPFLLIFLDILISLRRLINCC